MIAGTLRGDTLTLRSNAEMNGSVEYGDDAFTITANYQNGMRKVTFDRREILTVEINTRDFNPGKPPKQISVTEARSEATKDASRSQSGRGESSSGKPHEEHQSDKSLKGSVADAEDVDRATTDVVWLHDHTKIPGRLISLKEGRLTIKCHDVIREVDVQNVSTVLVAPE